MSSLKLQYEKYRMVCKKFALSPDVLRSSAITLQEKKKNEAIGRLQLLQGSFRLFCRGKLYYSKSLANNLERNMKKLTVSESDNFTNDPNCLQAFLFQQHLMMVVDQNDVVKHDRFQ